MILWPFLFQKLKKHIPMKLKQLTLRILASLFLASTSYSQTIILSDKKDTLIGFTIPQAKFLLKQPAKVKEQSSLLSVCEKQRLYQDSSRRADSIIIKDQKTTIENKEEAIVIKDMLCKADKDDLNSEIDRQKRQKWIVIGVGILVAGLRLASEFIK